MDTYYEILGWTPKVYPHGRRWPIWASSGSPTFKWIIVKSGTSNDLLSRRNTISLSSLDTLYTDHRAAEGCYIYDLMATRTWISLAGSVSPMPGIAIRGWWRRSASRPAC
jgi:hypothetical protein